MITFGVSVPANGKDAISGYRLFKFQDDVLTPLPVTLDSNTDKNVIIQKFCYLKPRDRLIVPECQNGGLMDSSDYLLVAKSNGIIEIFRDYRYKVSQAMKMKPDFILTCIPVAHERDMLDLTIAGLEYKDGLLYCCTKDGDLYIFILNLPGDYIQIENIYNPMGTPDLFDVAMPNARDYSRFEEGILLVYSKFTGRTKLQHICYYCLPMGQQISIYPQLKILYPNIHYFKPCIYVNLKKEVSNFRINPLDRFSFIAMAPRIPLTIYKIHLPKLFTDFFIKFIKLKKAVLRRFPQEVQDIDEASTKIYNSKFLDFLRFDFRGIQTDMDPRTWNSLMTNDYVAELSYSCVWRQHQGNTKDDLYRLFHRQVQIYDGDRERPASRGSLTGSADNSIRSNSLRRSILERSVESPPCYSNSATDRFIRCLRQNTCPVDIRIVNTKLGANPSQCGNTEDEQDNTRTSFLTDEYKDMDIITLDKFLCLTAFRPKYIDEPLMKLDSFHSIGKGNTDKEAQWAILNLSSFKKLFMITNSLCLIFDTFGVVLIDRFKLVNNHDLLKNDPEAFKIIDYEIGLINDIAVVITAMKKCQECESVYDITLDAIVTTVSGTLSVLHAEFYSHQRLGKMHCRDRLKVNSRDKIVEQVVLLDYEPNRKRLRTADDGEVAKRSKMEI
ncbi:HCL046Wp [Eremothecium sinecaudum]|uniref:HCL046Wp n=1 Tax=Eremothecium sinecaudum TaxID=45286 RepID=A0A0X8HRH3_9SACH|nr:HCL046Wp [Eremothecium sinecaudum]AMD20105.1 HCL046Wp [Eremothecium sinecaudum]